MKRRLSKLAKMVVRQILRASMIEFLLTVAFFVAMIFVLDITSQTLLEKINLSVFLGVITAFLFNAIVQLFKKTLLNWVEDSNKLNDDYKQLVSKYPRNTNDFLCANRNFLQRSDECDEKDIVRFPIIANKLSDVEIEIVDSEEQYRLPELISKNYDSIMRAHSQSKVFNQLNIRLDSYSIEGKDKTKLVMKTSRTTYYDSLVTNRAMDYQWGTRSTIRELFEYGPFVRSLEESKLSNHLGFNGFIETDSGDLILVKRSRKVSVGKAMLGTSVAASLKVKYALDEDKRFTTECLLEAMKQEIHDELKLDGIEITHKNIIAVYRDFVEGGKPQLFIHAKINQSTRDVIRNFKDKTKKKEKHNMMSAVMIDGDKLVPIKLDDIQKIETDHIKVGRKTYQLAPGVAASLAMLRQYKYPIENSKMLSKS